MKGYIALIATSCFVALVWIPNDKQPVTLEHAVQQACDDGTSTPMRSRNTFIERYRLWTPPGITRHGSARWGTHVVHGGSVAYRVTFGSLHGRIYEIRCREPFTLP